MADPIVLVVDDEPNLVMLCRRLLEREHFMVVGATNAAQALQLLQQVSVDLLLSDIRMPGIGGFELVNLVRKQYPELSTVIMTGYGSLDMAMNALTQGADGLIIKPFSAAELVNGLRRALRESQQRREILRLHALRPLFDMAETFFAETDQARLSEKIVEAICARLSSPIALLGRGPAGNGALEILAQRGDLPGELHLPDLLPRPSPLWLNHPNRGDQPEQSELDDWGLGALMLITIPRGDQRFVFLSARTEPDTGYRESDLELFQVLSQQAAAALENARLVAELQENLARLEASQQALLQAEKMAAAGRLTATIAHEINNPLQSLHNCLHLATRPELSAEDRAKYLALAQTELERLMTTTQRMLAFFRPGASDRKSTDVNLLVENTLALLEPQLHRSGVEIETTLTADLPPIMAVPGQLQQVLINLVLNAMEAMPDGGKVWVRTGWGPVQATTGEGQGRRRRTMIPEQKVVKHTRSVKIVVEDTGSGVPPEVRDNIFDPFFSTKESGTGLGLAVSYGILAAHGGSLALVDKDSPGACFQMILPEEE